MTDKTKQGSPSLQPSYNPPYGQGDHWRPSYRHDVAPRPADRHPVNRRERLREQVRPERDSDAQGKSDSHKHNPSMKQYSAQLSDTSRVMPKHFPKPLTCFYWANQGRCSKSDEDCWYAHYWTGVVAAAPVRIGNGAVAVAGREAEKAVEKVTERESSLAARQDTIVSREQDLSDRQQAVAQSASNLKANMQDTYAALSSVVESNIETTRALERRRMELMTTLTRSGEQHVPMQAIHGAVTAMDGALEALATLKVKVDAITYRLKSNIGNFDGASPDGGVQVMAGTDEEYHIGYEDDMP